MRRVLGLDPRCGTLRLRQQARALGLGPRACSLRLGLGAPDQDCGFGVGIGRSDLAFLLHPFAPPSRVSGPPPRARARSARAPARARSPVRASSAWAWALASSTCLPASWIAAVDLAHLGAELRLDLEPPHLPLLGDLQRLGLALALDARVLGGHHRLLARLGGLGFARRLDLLDLQALADLGLLLLLLQQQAPLGGLELGLADGDLGVGLDLRTLLPVAGDDLGQLAHPHRVEGVVFVERCEGRLVQSGERDRVEQHAVHRQVLAQLIGNVTDELAPLLVEAIHGLGSGHRLQGVHEAAFEQVADALGVERPRADGLGGGGDAFDRRAARARRTPAPRRRGCGPL